MASVSQDSGGRGAERSDPLEIRREALTSAVATRLIEALNAELLQRYPEDGATHFRLDAAEVGEGRGAFLVAYAGGEAVACGAIRRIDEGTAEIKRMYVDARFRRRGISRVLLRALESEAVRIGLRRIILETGERQGEAIGLYESAGFVRTAPFGEYVGSPLSICMEKRL